MIKGHVEWEKAYDAAVTKGRAQEGDREQAIKELKALGLTEGDAVYAIDRKRRA